MCIREIGVLQLRDQGVMAQWLVLGMLVDFTSLHDLLSRVLGPITGFNPRCKQASGSHHLQDAMRGQEKTVVWLAQLHISLSFQQD